MRKLINVALAYVTQKFALRIEKIENGYRFSGAPFMIKYMKSYETIGINLSFVESFSFGEESEDGNCTGILKALKMEEADASFVAFPMQGSSVAQFTQASGEYLFAIASATGLPMDINSDIIQSIQVFDLKTTILTIIFFLCLFAILKSKKIMSNPFQMIEIFFSQNLIDLQEKRGLYSLALFFTMFVLLILSAAFNTDLSVKIPGRKLNTLDDVADANVLPMFVEGLQLDQFFRNPIKDSFRRVWKSVQKYGENRCILRFTHIFRIIDELKEIIEGNLAIMIPTDVFSAAVRISCTFDPKLVKKTFAKGRRGYISPPFFKSIRGYFQRKNIESEKKQRLQEFYYNGFECGLFLYYFREIQNVLNEPVNCECEFSWYKNHEPINNPIILKQFAGLFNTYSILIIISIFFLLIEFFTNRNSNVQREFCEIIASTSKEDNAEK